MKIAEIILHRVRVPLSIPYNVAYFTFDYFEPILVEVLGDDGSIAWGEGHVQPGSTTETRDGGWAFCRRFAEKIIGLETVDAKALIAADRLSSKVAATGMLTAIEMLERHPLLDITADARVPILSGFNSLDHAAIPDEVEERLALGFKTFKIKVGKDVDEDLARVRVIQKAIDGRALMRLDANRGFNQEDGCRFASALDPSGIMLFEQPCEREEWDANAAVAAVSTVPIMLDEPITTIQDVERAGTIDNVGFCKIKLKRAGTIEALEAVLNRIHECSMEAVLGDGTSCEVQCWMEAAVSRTTIRNAGEFNGFLRPSVRLLANPLDFADGEIRFKAGYWPEMDRDALAAHEIDVVHF
jgi:L-alanine-DL-glutamate epimerase-like enolase superfamily enzyme